MFTIKACLISALSVVIIFTLATFNYQNQSVWAQETISTTTLGSYNIESSDPDAFEDNAEGAVDSAIELLKEAILGPLTKNTTESAKVIITDEIASVTQNMTGYNATKNFLKTQLDNLIESAASTTLTFSLKIDTECKPPSEDCLFRISLEK